MTEAQSSSGLSALYAGWVAAEGEIENILKSREVEVPIKDKANPGQYKGKYKFTYAELGQILHQVREPLTKNGVWYTQYVRAGWMITRVFHKSGQWMETGMLPMPNITGSPQDIGSVITYFKRYSISCALGLATEEDVDGQTGADSGREVSFSSHGTPRQRDSGPPAEPNVGIEAPANGWGQWTRELIEAVNKAETTDILDDIREDEKQRINAVRRVDKVMYDDIGKAFTDKRAVLDDGVPF